jgi:4-oxalocrotonate tautomerase
MPFIRITVLGPKLTSDQVDRLEQGTTELMATVMRKATDGIAVLVEHLASAGWSIAGRSVSVAAHVDAIIGEGTNTTGEKARFMADMWKLLRSVLGPELREESYVVLHAMDTRSYGRGGVMRAERDRQQEAATV